MLFLDGRKLRRLLAHARGGLGVSAALLRLEPPLLELAHLILGGFESLRLHVQLLLHQLGPPLRERDVLLAHLLEFFGLSLHVVLHPLELLGFGPQATATLLRVRGAAGLVGSDERRGLGVRRHAAGGRGRALRPFRAVEPLVGRGQRRWCDTGRRFQRRRGQNHRLGFARRALDAARARRARAAPACGRRVHARGRFWDAPVRAGRGRAPDGRHFVHRGGVVMLQQAAVVVVVLLLHRERSARDVHRARHNSRRRREGCRAARRRRAF